MKVQVQSYNSIAGAWNGEFEETAAIRYVPRHRMDNPAEVEIYITDDDGSKAQEYKVNITKDLAGAVADDGGVETDETTEANEDTADDMNIFPAVAAVNDAYYFGFDRQAAGMTLSISTAGVSANSTIDWEYSQGADAWAALAGGTQANYNDFSDFTVAEHDISWTVPGDWATDEVGSISGKYWVRVRVTAFIPGATSPLGKQAWTSEVFPGPGKVTIEDPDATDFFIGRIMRAEATVTGTKGSLILYCEDWLSQLNDEQITYEMREDLDSDDDTGKQGLRESYLYPDHDNATIVDVSYSNGGLHYVYDDKRSWNADEFNTKYLVLSDKMAGTQTIEKIGPYDEVVTGDGAGIDNDAGDETNLWEDETANAHVVWDNDEDWTQDYYFRVHIGDNDASAFYVDDSVKAASFEALLWFSDNLNVLSTCEVQVYNNNGAAWVTIDSVACTNNAVGSGAGTIRKTFTVPEAYRNYVVDNTGVAKVRFNVARSGACTAYLYVYFIEYSLTCLTTGYSSAILINDTIDLNAHGGKVNCIETATDMTAAATQVWSGTRYAIAKKIYLHIESATGPILGGDSMVTLTCGAANVENTSGISTRQYVNKTRLEIAQDLARQDKAHLWMELGTTTVTYKSTFAAGAADETLTDGDYLSLMSTLDYSTLVNKATVYGMRIGDQRLESSYSDATSITKYKQTRTKVVSDAGLTSEYDTLARATALVNQQKDVQQILICRIRGNVATAAHNKTMKIGDEIQITSTRLGLSSAWYIVQSFEYDSDIRNNMSTLRLHPRVSAIGLQEDERVSVEDARQGYRRGDSDKYVAEPSSNEVS
ncbi:MAG: hypothetical protein ACYTBJ_06150 [Planctomycetota bacterium]|jgi:hypothetical protein